MWIELSEFNIKLFIPLIFPAFKRLQDFTKKLYIEGKEPQTLFKTFRYYLCHILAFIPLLIVYFRTKKAEKDLIQIKEENSEKIETKLTLSRNDTIFKTNTITDLKIANDRKKRIRSYLFLGGLCLISLSCYYYRYFLEKKFPAREFKQSMGIFFDISGYIIFSYLILKQKLYLHSYISMGIIGVLLIALFIITCFYIEDKNKIWISLLYYFFYSSFFVLYDVLKKKYMNMFFNTPYFMMLVIGIFGCVFVLIYDLIAFLINRENEEIQKAFIRYVNGVGPAFAFILDIFLQFIWNLGIWLTIYYLTPCHTFMSEYISEYIYYIQDVRNPPNKGFYQTHNVVIFSLFAFINFCCCLIFNEVVILNFCNLDYNTKKRIQERQRHESRQTNQAQVLLDNDENGNIELSSQNSNDSASNN